MIEPPEIPVEVEALLWAALEREASESVESDEDAPEAAFTRPLPGWPAVVEDHDQLLAEWEHASREVAKWQAVQVRILADALEHALRDGTQGRTPDLEVRSLAAELALAVGMSDRTIAARMGDALTMRESYGRTMDALREGRMSRTHAQVIVDEGTGLDDPAIRAEYERIVLDRAGGLTTARLRAVAKAIAEQLMPTTLAERHADARSQRSVMVHELADGMAELRALIPTVLAHGIYDRLTGMGRTIQDAEKAAAKDYADSVADTEAADAAGAADPAPVRTIDQIRADVFCDLLLTGHPTAEAADELGGEGLGAIRGIVQITVPAAILRGEPSLVPATLPGGDPVDPDTACRLAGSATVWDRVLTDPFTGDVRAADRRFPSEGQRRLLRARDEHCRFPGCRMAVWRCDIDHTEDHAHGGKTDPCNLAHLCRRHHMMKHHTAWGVEQRDRGVLIWTSPAGRTYADRPPPTLRFIPEPETAGAAGAAA